MKYFFKTAVILFLLLFGFIAGIYAGSVEPVTSIYFIPHPDDGVLSMGADMALQHRLGRRVIIVMVTSGDDTGVRQRLCIQKKICLTRDEIAKARYAESAAAVKRMAPNAVIRYENYHGGDLTQVQALDIYDSYIKLYPQAAFKTISWLDENKDHRALAYALRDFCINRHRMPVERCYFFQNRKYWKSMPVKGTYIDSDRNVLEAAKEFSLWKPSIGRYAVGHLSAYDYFAALRKDPRNKYHWGNAN